VRTRTVAVILCVVSSACRGPATPITPGDAQWRFVDLGQTDEFGEVTLAASSAGIVLTGDAEGKAPLMWFSPDGERWLRFALPGVEPDDQEFTVTAGGGGPKGLMIAAHGFVNDVPAARLWHSADGNTWTEVIDDDFSGAGILYDVLDSELGFVAVGDVRSGGNLGPLEPAIWLSADGRQWERVVHEKRDGFVITVEEFEGAVLGFGSLNGKAVAWRSEDGRSWKRLDLPGELAGAQAVVPLPDRLIVLGTSSRGFTSWASQDGTDWEIVADGRAFGSTSLDADSRDEPTDAVPFAGGAVTSARLTHRTDLRWCYVDVAACGQPTWELLFSEDGASWRVIDLPEDLTRPFPEPVVAAFHDRLAVAGIAGQHLGVWLTDRLPTSTPLEQEAIPELPFDIVNGGETLEPGVEYGYPLYTHCGIDILGKFNSKMWVLESEPSDAPPRETWPFANGQFVYGTMRLVAPDRIEYSVSEGVIGVYTPSKSEVSFACD
jgi:hypothetical protein